MVGIVQVCVVHGDTSRRPVVDRPVPETLQAAVLNLFGDRMAEKLHSVGERSQRLLGG